MPRDAAARGVDSRPGSLQKFTWRLPEGPPPWVPAASCRVPHHRGARHEGVAAERVDATPEGRWPVL